LHKINNNNKKIPEIMTTNAMKHFFVFLCLLITSVSMQAQDLIVTNEGDSLNCKITRVRAGNVYFTFSHYGEIRNTLLPVSQIAHYQMSYYSTPEVSAHLIPPDDFFPRFRIAVSGGWSYRTASLASDTPHEFKSYLKKLKSGFHYDLGLSYYFSEQYGVGFKYNEFHTSNKVGNVYVEYEDGKTEYGDMSHNDRIRFMGPLFGMRFLNLPRKNTLVMELGLGYMGYQSKGNIVNNIATVKGNTVGTYLSIGYDIGLSKNFALGFQVSMLTGTLTQVTIFDGKTTEKQKLDKNQQENLSRIDLSIGLRFNN
jgi:hypothetical protein